MQKTPSPTSLCRTNRLRSLLASYLIAGSAFLVQPVSAQKALDSNVWFQEGTPTTDANGNTTTTYNNTDPTSRFKDNDAHAKRTVKETKNASGKIIKQVFIDEYGTRTGEPDDSLEKGGWTEVGSIRALTEKEFHGGMPASKTIVKYDAQHHLKETIIIPAQGETGDIREKTDEFRHTKEGTDVLTREVIVTKSVTGEVLEKEVRIYDENGKQQTGGSKTDGKGKQTQKWNPKKGDLGGWEPVAFTPSTNETAAPPTNDEIKTASVPDRLEFGFGYSYMHPADETVKNLNGFTATTFYRVNSWLAVGGDFSGFSGTDTKDFPDGNVKTSLDRYLYLIGPRFTVISEGPFKVYGSVLAGGVHDHNVVSFSGGSVISAATAFAMAVGAGVDVRVAPRVSVGLSVDYAPTNFTGPAGNNWQNNWRMSFIAKTRF
jgi:opacity protein-like surface antigen